MKIEIRKHDSDKLIAVRANRIAIEPPPDGSPYILTAEVDDGDSPIRIVFDNGSSHAVKRIELTRRDTYFVKAFHKGAAKPHVVSSHHRKMPTTLNGYKRAISPETIRKLSEGQRKAWTPERKRKWSLYMKAKAKAQKENQGGTHGNV